MTKSCKVVADEKYWLHLSHDSDAISVVGEQLDREFRQFLPSAGAVIEDTLLVHSSIAKSCLVISEPRVTNERTVGLALCPLMPMSPEW